MKSKNTPQLVKGIYDDEVTKKQQLLIATGRNVTSYSYDKFVTEESSSSSSASVSASASQSKSSSGRSGSRSGG